MENTVVVDGLTHPHTEMHLETLEALDEVVGVVLVDPDESAREVAGGRTRKSRASYPELLPTLEHPGVSHVLVLDVYTRPYDPRRPQVCLDETSVQLIGETLIRGARVDRLINDQGSIRGVVYEQNGRNYAVRAPLVVGADGRF